MSGSVSRYERYNQNKLLSNFLSLNYTGLQLNSLTEPQQPQIKLILLKWCLELIQETNIGLVGPKILDG